MKAVVFANGKLQRKMHTLTASLNINADLVFTDGLYCLAAGNNVGGEVDDYLVVRADHKSRVLSLLSQAFYGISDTCGRSADERLFLALERMAASGHWRSMDEVETWLMDKDIPFTKQKLVVSDLS
jgi:hypothetical protein